MGAQHKEPKHLEIVFFTNFTDCKEISKRFGHLFIVNIQEAIVHPVGGKRLFIGCLRLCNLIFMMGENQILTACMDLNLISQLFFRHHRAFNMPARPSLAPGRLPVRLTLFFRLPKHEIRRILFIILTSYLQFTES